MNDEWTKKYDVFISYAHADAIDDAGKKVVLQIKAEIEAALRGGTVSRLSSSGLLGIFRPKKATTNPFVFLDSEALKWGMDWNSRITQCISNCQVFVYLLSPNYLRSEYCQRERLIWARQESSIGRLNQSTRPIYYIKLPQADNQEQNREIREFLISQMNAEPFFESLEQVRNAISRNRIQQIRALAVDIKDQINQKRKNRKIDCTILQGFNRFFVGRLNELSDLNSLICEKRNIPVITGAPGSGKSELAITYAFAYAENFPQGCFMIPMQGVTSWTEALDKMVEQIKLCLHGESLMNWGIPEDFDKHNADERHRIIWNWLWHRAKTGPLLLLLDNLDEMSLLGDSALRGLSRQEDLPDNLRIIATTRLNKIALSGDRIPVRFDLDWDKYQLKESDAFELFCRIGKDRFPFACCPMSDGKLLLDDVPENERPSPDVIQETSQEYASLKKIINLLEGHAWSLEIVAGFMAENFSHYSFQKELAALEHNPVKNLIGTTFRDTVVQSPETLLQPTLDKLLEFDSIAGDFGKHILFLASAASFFLPEQVPEYALKGIWMQQFRNEEITYDSGRKKAFSCPLALELLRNYRIVNGDGDLLKMHRLTRDVLQKRLSPEEIDKIIDVMSTFLVDFRKTAPRITGKQIRPWLGWATECLDKQESTHKDPRFLQLCIDVIFDCWNNFLHTESLPLLKTVSLYAESINDDPLTADIYWTKARFDADSMRYEQAEKEYNVAIEIQCKLASQNAEEFKPDLAGILVDLAHLYHDFYHFDLAEEKYKTAIGIFRNLVENKHDDLKNDLAYALEGIADLYRCRGHFRQAEQEYLAALKIWRELVAQNPEKYESGLACHLGSIADLHRTLGHPYLDQAEQEYKTAIGIFRKLVDQDYFVFNAHLEKTLCNYARLCRTRRSTNDLIQAEQNLDEAQKINEELAREIPSLFKPESAFILSGFADLHILCGHPDQAEKNFKDALEIYRELDGRNRDNLKPHLALTLCCYANFHRDLGVDMAEKEYQDAIEIQRELADRDQKQWEPDLASMLCHYAIWNRKRGHYDQAEKDFKEALTRYRERIENNRVDLKVDLAITLYNYVSLCGMRDGSGDLERGENLFAEAQNIYDGLDEYERDILNPDMASALGCLAHLHSDFELAQQKFQKALEIQRGLVAQNAEQFNFVLAEMLFDYVVFCIRGCPSCDLKQVEKDFNDARTIYNSLDCCARDDLKPCLAYALYMLANLHRDHAPDVFDQTDKEYRDAVTIQRELAEKNPRDFNFRLAEMLFNYVVLETRRKGKRYQAEKHFKDAHNIYITLDEEAQDDLKPHLAHALFSLARFHRDRSDFGFAEIAEKEYQEVLEIQRELAAKDQEQFEPDLASVLCNYAILNLKRSHYDQAEKHFKEALDIYSKLVKNNCAGWTADLAITLCNYAILHWKRKYYKQADEEFEQAIAMYEKLEKDDPSRFDLAILEWMRHAKQPDSNPL